MDYNKKEIISEEINRIKEIMGLPLLVEANIFGTGINFWKRLFNATSKADLTPDEIGIGNNLVKNSKTISKSYGQNSIDVFFTSYGKDLLQQLLKSEAKFELSAALKLGINEYYQNSIKNLSKQLDVKTNDIIRNTIKNQKTNRGTVLDVVVRIENEGFNNLGDDILEYTLIKLNELNTGNLGSYGKKYIDSLKDNISNVLDSRSKNFVVDADELTTNISKNLDSGTDPQAYLNNLSYDELVNRLGSYGWKEIGYKTDMMSGWKFHIFGEDIKDAVYLQDALKPVIDKYKAAAKVGGTYHNSAEAFKPGQVQHGKQGVTIYIPVDVVNNGKAREMLSDIQNAISGYKKGGTISGDKIITPAIHYRYELMGPIPKDGISNVSPGINPVTKKPIKSDYSSMYSENQGGPYKPDDIPDLFDNSVSKTVSNVATSSTNRLESIVGDTSLVNWSLIQNAKNAQDYSKLIDDAIKTGNYMGITRQGFEAYGIPNFREYLINLGLKN